MCSLLSHVRLFVTPWTAARQAPVCGILQERVLEWGALPFSRVSFLIQDSNPGLSCCRRILYHLSHQGIQSNQTSDIIKSISHALVNKMTHSLGSKSVKKLKSNQWSGVWGQSNTYDTKLSANSSDNQRCKIKTYR